MFLALKMDAPAANETGAPKSKLRVLNRLLPALSEVDPWAHPGSDLDHVRPTDADDRESAAAGWSRPRDDRVTPAREDGRQPA